MRTIIQEDLSPILNLSNPYRKPSISVIFSTYNEEYNPFFLESLKTLSGLGDLFEIIVVDRKSTDNTQSVATSYGAKVIESNSNSRGERLNLGAQKSSASLLLFHHPRTRCEVGAYLALLNINSSWGGLTHRFDQKGPLFSFTSWYSNNIRAKIKEIFYLDHCIFVMKDLFLKCEGFDKVDIFEDTLLSLKLRAKAPPRLLPFYATTSAKRFIQNGIVRQSLLNQILKLAFALGANDKLMNQIYEKGLNLNSKY